MAKIVIIGAGSFGTALGQVFARKNDVYLYSIEDDVSKEINKSHTNARYLKGVKLALSITSGKDASKIAECEIITIAVPSQNVSAVCKLIKENYSNQIIISTSKGLYKDGRVITDVIESQIQCSGDKVTALSGPSIANELARGLPTALTIGGARGITDQLVQDLSSLDFILQRTTDKKGIQLLGFYKNIIAILVGMCDGLRLGSNFTSALISKAYSEFYHLNIIKNIARHSFIGFAGLGDLYVTATSEHSRNRRFGLYLAEGNSIEHIKSKIGFTIEGYENLELLKKMRNKEFIDVNLLNFFSKVLKGNCTPDEIKRMLTKYLNSNEIKNIVFDWGAVLTQGNYSWRVAGYLSGLYGMDQKKLFNDLEKNETDALLGNETFLHYFKRVKNIYSEIKYDTFLKAYKESVTWDNDILNFCIELKNRYRLYLLSNNYSIISPLLKKSILKTIFKGMVFSNDVHLIKPKTDIFEYMLKRYKLRPENCLFVDDTHKNVKSAQVLKINTIEYKNVEQLKKEIEEKTF